MQVSEQAGCRHDGSVRRNLPPPGPAAAAGPTIPEPGAAVFSVTPPPRTWPVKPAPFYRALGIALLIEAAVIAGITWGFPHAPAHAVTQPPLRVRVHVVEPPPPLPPPVPVLTPARIMPPAPVRAAPSLPVIAVSSRTSLPHPTFRVPAQPLPPPPAIPAGNTASALARYTALLHAAIQSGLRVPGMVRAMRLRGIATVIFRLTPSGQLLWARLARSSGIPPIDNAALAKVKSSGYPPFPRSLPQQDTTFKIAVRLDTTR